MFRPRIIPVLLLKGRTLVKTVRFREHKYIGDPMNAVKIFNESLADELVFLDITASKENRLIPVDFVKEVGEEANMPFAIGGGIGSIGDIRRILEAGAEKVVLCTSAIKDPGFIRSASEEFGSSTIVVCIDVKKNIFGKYELWQSSAGKSAKTPPLEYAVKAQALGAGEIILQSVDRDGTMNGYDLDLIKKFTDTLSVPVVALGGAGHINDIKTAYFEAGANGLAAGSLFVFQGKNRGVLINYPEKSDKIFTS